MAIAALRFSALAPSFSGLKHTGSSSIPLLRTSVHAPTSKAARKLAGPSPVSSHMALSQRNPSLLACPPSLVRVWRVSEQGQRAQGAGRMVIAGRMADVCAELERLAALEAAQTHM